MDEYQSFTPYISGLAGGLSVSYTDGVPWDPKLQGDRQVVFNAKSVCWAVGHILTVFLNKASLKSKINVENNYLH